MADQIPYEVPLSPQAQVFSISLGGTTYRLTVQWNTAPTGGWVLNIADENDVPVIAGIPLVTGIDLLMQYPDAGINGSLEVQTDTDLLAVPDFSNLGKTSHLYFLTDNGT